MKLELETIRYCRWFLEPNWTQNARVGRCLRRSHNLGTALAPIPTAERGVRLQCVFPLKESCMPQ